MKHRASSLCAALGLLVSTSAADYSTLPSHLEPVIQAELKEWGIGGISVALVDDQEVVYLAGFGEATKESVFRCGSISKLFNAMAVLQQVEAGKLELDAPLTRYGDGLLPLNPFPGQPDVTLRQILSHRSGLPRESAVGGYLDLTEPTLAATVASVKSAVLVTVPGEKMRYSNLAPSVAGHLVERVTGQSFEAYQQARILGPLGMESSAWTRARLPRGRMIGSHIRVADGAGGFTRRETPLFDLGTLPAGNLYSSAGDLARFVMALADGGRGLVQSATLAEMWRPQLTTNSTGFGLGFSIGKFRDHRSVSHSGAVYGHSTSLVLLPGEKLGVIVLANEDIANGRVRRISQTALSLLLRAKLGKPLPESPVPFAHESLADFIGEFESPSFWAQLEVREGKLIGNISGQPTKLTPRSALTFVADSRLDDATPVVFERDPSGKVSEFTLGGQRYQRTLSNRPPLPPEWQAYLGSYGSDLIPVILSVRHGRLYAMTENMVDYALTPVNRQVCAFPDGMYVDEHLVILTDPGGHPWAINFANMILRRRP